MAEARDPFEYVSWCEGPSVDVSPLVDFPLCTEMSYVKPTLDLHHVDMTIPDMAPPQMCPCIWSFDTSAPGVVAINITGIDPASATGHIMIWPDKGEAQDCCDPTFNIDFSLDLPCIAFSITASGTATFGAGSGSFWISATTDIEKCEVKIAYFLSIDAAPCLAFSVTSEVEINIGTFEVGFEVDEDEDCLLKMSAHISLPVTTETFIVSIRVDASHGFQVYKKTMKVYTVVADLGWETIISVGSCTT